mmetsp:Transcript_10870/g.24977  ORF Transcript_10870/g.24977 Transcript_10870/m.24977 type:complete len:89 (-) Transcript_10870:1906-2172(-)
MAQPQGNVKRHPSRLISSDKTSRQLRCVMKFPPLSRQLMQSYPERFHPLLWKRGEGSNCSKTSLEPVVSQRYCFRFQLALFQLENLRK